jgi:hypothetical protein
VGENLLFPVSKWRVGRLTVVKERGNCNAKPGLLISRGSAEAASQMFKVQRVAVPLDGDASA